MDDHRCGLSLEKNKLRETLTEEEEMVSDACYQKKKNPALIGQEVAQVSPTMCSFPKYFPNETNNFPLSLSLAL